MVNTRSQVAENQRTHMCRPDRHSDTESESSVPEVLTREQINEFDNGNLLGFSGESERQAVNQRFTEMNRQISELTNLVLALTEKISSNEKSSSNDREGNAPNITTSNELDARSDNYLQSNAPIIGPLVHLTSSKIYYCHDPLPVGIIAAAVGYLVSKLAEDKAEVNSIKLT